MRLILVFLICFTQLLSQQKFVSNYSITAETGLGSNTIYSIFQKNNGLLYIAHDNGISRFNGKTFKQISYYGRTKSLSNLTEDKCGKIWARSFFGDLVFLKDDSITIHPYSKQLKVGMPTIYKGNNCLYVLELDKLFMLADNDSLIKIKTPNGISNDFRLLSLFKLDNKKEIVFYVSKKHLGYFIIESGKITSTTQSVFPYNDFIPSVFQLDHDFYIKSENTFHKLKIEGPSYKLSETECDINFNKTKLINVVALTNYLFAFQTFEGLILTDNQLKAKDTLLKGSQISALTKTNEGDVVIGTLQEGMYVFSSLSIYTIDLKDILLPKETIHAADVYNDSILVLGTFQGKVIKMDAKGNVMKQLQLDIKSDVQCTYFDKKDELLYVFCDVLYTIDWNSFRIIDKRVIPSTKRILKKNGTIFCATSYSFSRIDKEYHTLLLTGTWISDIVFTKGNKLILSTNNGWFTYDIETRSIKELDDFNRQLKGISTRSLQYLNEQTIYFIGINKGLMRENKGVLKELVNDKSLIDCKLNDQDLFLFSREKVIFYSTKKQAITYVLDVTKGLDKSPILGFDKLGKGYIKIGPRSLQLITRLIDINAQKPSLLLTELNGSFTKEDSIYVSDYGKNTIEFTLEPLPNIRSQGRASVVYRLKGIDEHWITLNQTKSDFKIKYQFLPSGTYTFEAFSINEDDIRSETFQFQLKVRTPYWLTWWFISLEVFAGFVILFLLYKWRMLKIRQHEKRKLDAERRKIRLLSAELTAIRSQMNPHFIFNSLSAIQAKVLSEDKKNAYEYLSTFSKLMRLVLDYSAKEYIHLNQEIDFLRSYLYLESGRTDGKLMYFIDVDANLDVNFLELPALITQPFVENAIRHGLLHKEGEKCLWIKFYLEANQLIITIKDNGIGREQSKKINDLSRIGHKSFATEAMQNRVQRINDGSKFEIKLSIHDLNEGTEVVIRIKDKNQDE